MKNLRCFVILMSLLMLVSSCRLWSSVFKPKYGCPTNGKNVGAERILSGDPDAMKAAKKAKKFKS
ncbi:MAG TPA: hypothetical protein VHD35_02650 [Chitinophagaceae bacterium]|nr:hypothetical protein [Chitinophagaceae bacterium]